MSIAEIASGKPPVSNRVLLVFWFILALVILLVDYATGPYIQFPFLFVLPVIFSTWYNGLWWGVVYAVALPLVRFYFTTVWDIPWTLLESALNNLIRVSVLLLLAYLVHKVAQQSKATATEVKLLEGLLPICASCKKIRDEKNEWQPLEAYITKHSEASFTHGVCPDCAKKLYNLDLGPH